MKQYIKSLPIKSLLAPDLHQRLPTNHMQKYKTIAERMLGKYIKHIFSFMTFLIHDSLKTMNLNLPIALTLQTDIPRKTSRVMRKLS